MRCEVCGEFLGAGEIGICGDCNALEHDIAEDRCDCCGEVRALCDLGDGFCSALVPRGEEIELMQELVRLRRLDVDDPDLFQKYRSLMIDRIKREGGIAPGVLRAGDDLVRDGDTLCCACGAPDALAGKCHRHWCARLLVEAGWEVEQDGRRILKEFLM